MTIPLTDTFSFSMCQPIPNRIALRISFALQQWLLLLALLPCSSLRGSTDLLPGLKYYEGPEQLKGKLVFLFCPDAARFTPWRYEAGRTTNRETAASIYAFDLSPTKLQKVTDCPKGALFESDNGDTFCVVSWRGEPVVGDPTNATAFIYSQVTAQKRLVILDSDPKMTIIESGHVFFQLEKWDYRGDAAATEILDYSIADDQMRKIKFADADRRQSQHYDRIHVPQGQTNVLHFYYHASGRRLGEGKEYRSGIYSLDIGTREIRWFADLTGDMDDALYTPRAFDGRFIFFEGPQSPASGFKLVSSNQDAIRTRLLASKGKQPKTIHVFSESSASKGATYLLNGISPCGRFALVRFQEMTRELSGWTNTYYLVDLLNGNTRILIRDDVERKTNGSMSSVRWVR